MKYPIHRGETGSFQELAHASDVEFGQLSLLTVAPRCSRGGHYHTRKREWFCCIHGWCYIVCSNVQTGEQRKTIMEDGKREFIPVNPYESHIVMNFSDWECELLVICSEEYDPENADTIKHEAKGEPTCSR